MVWACVQNSLAKHSGSSNTTYYFKLVPALQSIRLHLQMRFPAQLPINHTATVLDAKRGEAGLERQCRAEDFCHAVIRKTGGGNEESAATLQIRVH